MMSKQCYTPQPEQRIRSYHLICFGLFLSLSACLGDCRGDNQQLPEDDTPVLELEAEYLSQFPSTEAFEELRQRSNLETIAWVNGLHISRESLEIQLNKRVTAYRRGGEIDTPYWRNSQRVRIVAELIDEALLTHSMIESGELPESYGAAPSHEREQSDYQEALDRLLAPDTEEWSPERLEELYLEHRDDFQAGERIRLTAVALQDAEASIRQQSVEAMEVLEGIGRQQAGVGFSESEHQVAQREGASPLIQWNDTGWLEIENTLYGDEVMAELFQLEVGEVSPPVRTRIGYHLFLLTDRRPAGLRQLDEVRELVMAIGQRERRGRARVELFQRLREEGEIRYFPEHYGLEESE